EYVISRLLVCEEMNKKGYTQTFVAEKFNLTPSTMSNGISHSLARIRETKYPKKLYDIVLRFEEGDEATREKKTLLLRFFLFFRDRGEDYLGLTMEQFIDKFIEFENAKNRARANER
ncbi:MAG TPA: hypothetical protein VFC68_03475, partial [Treponemataceae bacterium]|nr:hypothetical protein [Treponemataceae bacterium]